MSELIIMGLAPSSYVRTARMICAAKGVDYTLQPVDFRAPEYRAHHPFGKMPAMQHVDVALFEALAIGVYVDETFDGPALQPSDTVTRARMFQWISATNDALLDTIVAQCVRERFMKPMRGLEPDEDAIAAAMPAITANLDVVDKALAGQTYLCGDQLTLADLFLAPQLFYFAATPEGRATLPDRANITAWMSEMAKTPDYATINTLGP